MPASTELSPSPLAVSIPRTTQDILARLEVLNGDASDFFGFQRSDLMEFLPFEEAKAFLKPEIVKSDWPQKSADHLSVKSVMLSYMPFAWEKANDCRGLSADRSNQHMKAWLWLLGDDLADKLDGMYEYYGKPCLRAICEKYGWDWSQWDDGRWRNSEDDEGVSPPATIRVGRGGV